MWETDRQADATGSPPMEITASDTGANGQTPAHQEQQVSMMPSQAAMEQSSTPIGVVQQPEATCQTQASTQQLQDALLQGNPDITADTGQTAQGCWNKETQMSVSQTTVAIQTEDLSYRQS